MKLAALLQSVIAMHRWDRKSINSFHVLMPFFSLSFCLFIVCSMIFTYRTLLPIGRLQIFRSIIFFSSFVFVHIEKSLSDDEIVPQSISAENSSLTVRLWWAFNSLPIMNIISIIVHLRTVFTDFFSFVRLLVIFTPLQAAITCMFYNHLCIL